MFKIAQAESNIASVEFDEIACDKIFNSLADPNLLRGTIRWGDFNHIGAF